jgi:hypothetical protein
MSVWLILVAVNELVKCFMSHTPQVHTYKITQPWMNNWNVDIGGEIMCLNSKALICVYLQIILLAVNL